MVHGSMQTTSKCVAAALLLALGASHTVAAEPAVVWVDNESFGFSSCGSLDALPGSQDPKELMNSLRERGLADASQLARTRGLGTSTVTLTPVSGSLRCEGASSMVFRLTSFNHASGQAWTGNLVSRLPVDGTTAAAARSTR